MNNLDYQNENKKYVLNTYGERKIALVKGKGAYVWDADGKKYLDFLSGIAVVSYGHTNPDVNKKIKKQLDNLVHTSNLFLIPSQIKTAELINKMSFKGKTFFCNSGTESNEAAIKLSKLRGNTIAKGKNKIITLKDSFHGRTTGSIKLTGQEKYQKGFEPLMENVEYIERNNITELEKAFDKNVCAIFLEPVQGESGIHPLTDDFVNKSKELCEKFDALLVFDEVQTGIGRTGKYFAYQYYDVEPDIITIAKALGNGFPIGAMHVNDKWNDVFKPGHHAATFGGNPICTSAAAAVLELLTRDGELDKINKIAGYLKNELEKLREQFSNVVKEIRGRGLMIGISVPGKSKQLHAQLLENGIITNSIGEDTLRILPPFIISEKDVDIFINTLKELLENSQQG